MRRRALLTSALAGSLTLPGCTTATRLFEPNLPEPCPTSQDLGVEWPRDLNQSTVATFVEGYEEQYYRQVVFDYEPESRFSRVGSAIARVKNVTKANGGWRVHFSGILGINEAFTQLYAAPSDPPDEADVVSLDEIDHEQLRELLNDAVETGEAELEISPGETDEYVDRFEAISEAFEISPAESRDAVYFDVNGTTVELVVSVDTYHSDRFWDAWYYVDGQVVWRSSEQDIDPRDADLLECRTSG